jgi:hypothetical protein
MQKRKWRWLGHTLRKPRESITRQVLYGTLKGNEEREDPETHGGGNLKQKLRKQI